MSLRELLTVNKVRISGAVLLAAAGALAFGACGDDDGDFENCGNGITCPAPLICAARQAKCLETPCGNGLIDEGEECDDGNVLGGDGCSADCKFETCGDGIVQRQRITYDDRGTAISVEQGEVCDWAEEGVGPENCLAEDAKDAEGNVLIAACRSNRKCGNGVVDPGEVCDHGNGLDSVGNWVGNVMQGSADCSKDCNSDNSCGNGIIDSDGKFSFEECDVGDEAQGFLPIFIPGSLAATTPGAKCIAGCIVQLCGDGKVNGDEVCDSGAVGNSTFGCNSDCTASKCGDGKVNLAANEQCDTGNLNDPTQWREDGTWKGSGDCTDTCTLNRCGDYFVGGSETCDDGTSGSALCARDCRKNVCGDGYFFTNTDGSLVPNSDGKTEECDDGERGSRTCTIRCTRSSCGDGIVNTMAGEACDPGTSEVRDENGNWASCNMDCTLSACGDGLINQAAGEVCDPNTGATEGNPHMARSASVRCNADCTATRCGDGKLNPIAQEQCDPGDASRDANDPIGNWSDCNYDCTNVFCGDSVVNKAAGEECDPGTGIGQSDSWQAQAPSVRCNIDCTLSRCGDGKVNAAAGEECDPGESGDWSGCSRETCTLVRSSGAR